MSELNDPRVFLAAERSLLAWNRTALALMAFGFAIERFGLFMHVVLPGASGPWGREFSFWVGLTLVLFAAALALLAVLQFRRLLATLKPVEIPAGYGGGLGMLATLAVGVLGVALALYLLSTTA